MVSIMDLAATDFDQFAQAYGNRMHLISPSGEVTPVDGLPHDISATLDPDTGGLVSGRSVRVGLSKLSLAVEPQAVQDGPPWRAQYTTAKGAVVNAVVTAVDPDHSMAVIMVELTVSL